jgi:hypothetical protein
MRLLIKHELKCKLVVFVPFQSPMGWKQVFSIAFYTLHSNLQSGTSKIDTKEFKSNVTQ